MNQGGINTVNLTVLVSLVLWFDVWTGFGNINSSYLNSVVYISVVEAQLTFFTTTVMNCRFRLNQWDVSESTGSGTGGGGVTAEVLVVREAITWTQLLLHWIS